MQVNIHASTVLVLKSSTALSRNSGWRYLAEVERSGSFGCSNNGGNEEAAWHCGIIAGRNRAEIPSVLSKREVLKFKYVLKQVSENRSRYLHVFTSPAYYCNKKLLVKDMI